MVFVGIEMGFKCALKGRVCLAVVLDQPEKQRLSTGIAQHDLQASSITSPAAVCSTGTVPFGDNANMLGGLSRSNTSRSSSGAFDQ